MRNLGKHHKYVCYVDDVKGSSVWLRTWVEDNEYEFRIDWALATSNGLTDKPVPKLGQIVTLHQTKAGKPYIYVVDKPKVTKRQIKKVRQKVRKELDMILSEEESIPTTG